MAVSGSVTAVYTCWWEIDDSGKGRLMTKPTARLRNECTSVDDALSKLRLGEACIVAEFDMDTLRERLKAGV